MEFLPLLYLIIHSVQAVTLDIPQEARMLRGKTIYTLYTESKTWKNAREMCRLTGGYLMNVDTYNKLDILHDIKSTLSSDYSSPWIGLYWSSSVDMHNDGPGCASISLSPNYHWKADTDAEYKDGEVCYRENTGFENKPCKEKNKFICETYQDWQGCSMNSSNSIVFDVEKIDQSNIASCNDLCYTKVGCFLSGSVNSTYCGMLLTPDVANFTVGVKNCGYEMKVNRTTHTLDLDEGDPTDCIAVPDNQNGTTYGCPTIVEQLIERVNVTIIQTNVVTDYVTQTFEKTIVETVSHAVPTTIFSTQQLTITTTEQLVTTQATTIAPSYIVTTVIQPTTITLDGTTIVSTVTDTASHIVPTTILSTELITITTTKLLETQTVEFITITPSQVVSTVIQPTTVTFTPATVLVTVTETPSPIVCPIPTTLTFSVPCTDKHVSSVSASACIEQSSVKPTSFGALGFLDPEGVLRTNICHDVIVVTPDESATQRAVSSIVRALTVEKSNISAVFNKKISAPDYRSSSTAIGYFGIILFSLPFVFLLAMDGISLLAKIQRLGLLQRSFGQK